MGREKEGCRCDEESCSTPLGSYKSTVPIVEALDRPDEGDGKHADVELAPPLLRANRLLDPESQPSPCTGGEGPEGALAELLNAKSQHV